MTHAKTFLTLLALVLALGAQAANHYVRAGAGGTASGNDWANAYTDLPATLVRGDLYYMATGTYAARIFNTADSGSAFIEIRSATIADHGTATGWNDAYQGQATFQAASGRTGIVEVDTDYWIFNGVYRNANGTNGHGLHFSNVNGNANGYVTGAGAVVHDLIFKYVDMEGSHPTSDGSAGVGAYVNDFEGGCYQVLWDHCAVHDGYTSFFIKGGNNSVAGGSINGSRFTIQNCYVWHCYDSANFHGEASSSDEGLKYFALRYNTFFDSTTVGGGTAIIATPSGGSYTAGNQYNGPWYIYGNVFRYSAGYAVGVGDATIDFFDVSFNPGGDVWIANNTFANLGLIGGTASGYAFGSGFHAQMSGVYIFNDVWYNSANMAFGANGGTFTSTTYGHDYNQYYQMADSSSSQDTGAHKVVTAGSNPFTSTSTYDFTLTTNTAAGLTLTNVGTYWDGTNMSQNTMTVDMLGTTRGAGGSWDRGAFQFVSGGGTAPSITVQPQNQSVTVGQTATFSVTATGDPTLTYQWKKNGTDIAGATLSNYTTPATVLGDSGELFSAGVTNGVGGVVSSTATLTVTSPSAVVKTIGTSSVGNGSF